MRQILIIDDNQKNRESLEKLLQDDYEFLEAANGREALDIMLQNSKTLLAVILDVSSPVMNGYKILKLIRENDELALIPIIAVTDGTDEQTRMKALSMGANDILIKPFNPNMVLHCLQINISRRKAVPVDSTTLTGTGNTREANTEQLAVMADSIPGGYISYEFTPTGLRLLYFSDGFCALFGCTREEYAKAAESGPLDRVFEEDRPALLAAIKDLREHNIPVTINYRIHVKGGGYRWVGPQCSQISRIGDQTLFHAALFDVTEKQESVHKTAVLAQQLKAVLDNINGGVSAVSFGVQGEITVLFANDLYYEMFGVSRDEVENGRFNLWNIVHPADCAKIKEKVDKLLSDHIPSYFEYRCIKFDGSIIHVRCDASVMQMDGVDGNILIANVTDVTSEKAMIEQLRISEEEARLAIEHGNAMVCRYDVASRKLIIPQLKNPIFSSKSVLENIPYETENLNTISPDTRAAYTDFYERILRGEKTGSALFRKQSSIGERWIDAKFSTIISDDKPVSAVTSFFDVTEQMEKEAVYKKWQQSMNDRAPNTYMLFRGNISKNTVFDSIDGTLLPITYPETLTTFDQQVAHYTSLLVHPDEREWYLGYLRADAQLARYYRGNRNDAFEYRELTPDGGFRWIKCTAELVEYPNSTDVQSFLMYEDINSAKLTELEMQERAESDPLTGILNRATLEAKVDSLLAKSPIGSQHALIMLDIDNFKQVNDTFGHGAGDQTLIETAKSLHSAIRRGDLLARLGGDEFVIFLADIPGDNIAQNKAWQISKLIHKHFNKDVKISASIGIALSPRNGTTFKELYKKADLALYHVKYTGKNNSAFYSEDKINAHSGKMNDRINIPGTKQKPAEKRRMLVVDDNPQEHTLVENLFADAFDIYKAFDGGTALEQIRHYGTAISVVLLDLIMPDVNGFEVLKGMQESQLFQNIPVVVVSGSDDLETCIRAIRAGATDYVTKPFAPEVLKTRVNAAVSKAENEKLKAKASRLEYQNSEIDKLRSILKEHGIEAD